MNNSPSSDKSIILTVPHGKCPLPQKSSDRMCDIAAMSAAECMAKLLKGYNIFIPGDEYRYDHDLNRKESRKTNYRSRLSNVFKHLKNSNVILLDIHSFPNYYDPRAGDINFFKSNEIAPDFVLLRGKRDIYNGQSICNIIHQELREHNINVKIIENIEVLDILNEADEYNIPGVLCEFNEKLRDDNYKDLLKSVCIIITNCIKSL